jgi:medium-chain acyl-[acyl-carrier-protein] hydrolase
MDDEAKTVWRERVRVRAYELDVWGRASALAVCNWFQEAAGNHATHLGWGIENLQAQGLTWVLSRLHLRLHRLPLWREEVEIATWPAGAHRLFAVREFRLSDADGAELGVATSGWIVVSQASLRPLRPAAEIVALGRSSPTRALADGFDRLPEVEHAEFVRALDVRIADLDINRHANNVSVIGWALEPLPLAALEGRRLGELEVEFRGEARGGERVLAEAAAAGDGAFIHRVVREADGREVARARSRWSVC